MTRAPERSPTPPIPIPIPPEPDSQPVAAALRLSFGILRVVMIVLLVLTVVRSSVFIVPQQQRAVILRFGRIAGHGDRRIREPGAHLAFPVPIDEVVRLPGDQMLTVTSDSFHHGLDPESPEGANHRRPYFHATLTADRNLLHSRWILRYTVISPETYAFAVNDMERLVALELDRAVILAMARTPVDRALRADRDVRETVHRILEARIAALDLGIRIQQVETDRMTPPPGIAAAFDDVIRAEQESNEWISQARIAAARRIGDARGVAAARIAAAQGAALRLAETTAADAATLTALLAAGLDDPDGILAVSLWMDRLAHLFGGETAPRVIRLRRAPEHREIRLLLGGDSAAAGDGL